MCWWMKRSIRRSKRTETGLAEANGQYKLTCSVCGREFYGSLRTWRWKQRHKPHWRTYCSNTCKGEGLRRPKK